MSYGTDVREVTETYDWGVNGTTDWEVLGTAGWRAIAWQWI
jgi:hypothetical protein